MNPKRNILIIGGGETAHDIAVNLANISKKVYMSIRNGQWFQGKLLGGNEPADLQFNRLMNLIWYKPYSNLIAWMNSQIWGYGGSGIKKWYPTSGYFDSFFTKGREIFLWISKGKIIPCGGITNIEKDMIYFDDKEENIDYIILCTGYENSHLKTLLPNVEFDKNNNFVLVVSDFYYLDSANNLKQKLVKETKINSFFVRKINDNKYRLSVGPFENFNALKSVYISLNNLGFEELNIYKE